MIRILASLVVIAIGGCARAPIVPEIPTTAYRQETSRNYVRGQRMRTNVGDSIIRVKDYHLAQIFLPFMTPTESFSFAPGSSLSFTAGEKYRVLGAMERADRTWVGVSHPVEVNYTILVADDGVIHEEIFRRGLGYRGPYPVNPPTARMKRTVEERVEMSKPYTNYEIIYNGTDKNSLLFTYREFSPEGQARTAFYQNLTYDAKATTIRFKQFRIQVHAASGEEIEFTVLEDDTAGK